MTTAPLRRLLTTALLVGTLASVIVACAADLHRSPPGSLLGQPLGPPDLAAPSDRLTGRRLASLSRDPALCLAVLKAGGPAHSALPPFGTGACRVDSAVRLQPRGTAAIALRPDSPAMSCPLAAATHLWLRDVVQPAAQAHFGSRVSHVDHVGTYACRNIYGDAEGKLSEHAGANALDIAGVRLSDGRRIRVLEDWNGEPAARAFLREIRDGACRLYGTTLSPDYNAAHRDHLHLDMATRSGWNGGYCR